MVPSIEMCDLDERDTQDSGQAKHPVVQDKGKKPIALDDVDTLENDELSSGNSPIPSQARSKSNTTTREAVDTPPLDPILFVHSWRSADTLKIR